MRSSALRKYENSRSMAAASRNRSRKYVLLLTHTVGPVWNAFSCSMDTNASGRKLAAWSMRHGR